MLITVQCRLKFVITVDREDQHVVVGKTIFLFTMETIFAGKNKSGFVFKLFSVTTKLREGNTISTIV